MPAPSDGRRTRRVAELIQRHFADALRRELDDPRLAAVVVTGVDVTDDLMIAKIGVRLLIGDDDPKQRRAIIERLKRAAPRLRRVITPRLELKRAPELRFSYDEGPDAQRRVEDLLREVAAEPKHAEPVQPSATAGGEAAAEAAAPAKRAADGAPLEPEPKR